MKPIRSKYSKVALENLVRDNTSVASCIRKLGLRLTGGNYRHIRSLIDYYGISTSHFTGKGWSKGKTANDNESLGARVRKVRKPDSEVFIENSYPISGSKIVKRLLKLGYEYKCSICGNLGSWLGSPLTLHLDHINGVRNDNRLENLRLLCPNCHQQTDTCGNKVDRRPYSK